ncbi:alpha-1,2-fucosyltransferase [Mucilaginibacter sp. HD30]
MDVIIIFNGLGNQMSQYAYYLNKKQKSKSVYLLNLCESKSHNGFELGNVFGIIVKENIITYFFKLIFKFLTVNKYLFLTIPLRQVLKKMNCRIIYENFDYTFKPEYLLPSAGITFFYGGWHSEKYFNASETIVKNTFEFTHFDDNDILNIEHLDNIHHSNSVALHVRRGDYLNTENISIFGNISTKKYFENAISIMNGSIDNPHYFVFSNDVEWVKVNLDIKNVTYVTNNSSKDSWKDMYLMTQCKHNIISNSTFSWWGAWLNSNEKKIVICPAKYLNNDIVSEIYSPSWHKIMDL